MNDERGEMYPWLPALILVSVLIGTALWLGLLFASRWLRWSAVGAVGGALAVFGLIDLVRAVHSRHQPPPGAFAPPAPSVVGALVTLAAAVVALGLGVAHAQTSGGGFLGGGNLGANISDALPAGSGESVGSPAQAGGGSPSASGPSASSGPTEASPYRWERHYYGDQNDPGFGRNSPFLCGKNPDGSNQLPYTDIMIDTRDGSEVRRANGCQGVDDPATPQNEASPPPPPPPPPPSAGEVLDRIPIPNPTFGISPAEGLAGARGEAVTALWDENGQAPLSVTVTIRGYTVTATASPGEWEWDMLAEGPTGRNPSPILRSNRPGTREDPAATYTYETKGSYRITLRTTWGGSFSFSGNGVPGETRPLGSTTQESSTSYTVREVRSVLEGLAA